MMYLGALVDGALLGAAFAGIAVGFSLVFGIANILNLAHGGFIVLGGYIVYFFQTSIGLNPFLAGALSIAITYALGYATYRWSGLSRLVMGPLLMVIVFTFGLDLVIVHGLAYVFGMQSRSIVVPDFLNEVWFFGEIFVPVSRVTAAIGGIAITIGIDQLVRHTKLGRAIRATRQDRDMASLNGVKVAEVYAHTMGIGCATAAAAGFLLMLGTPINPESGIHYLLIAFAVAILGGFGRIDTIIIAAVLYGVVLSVTQTAFGSGIGTATSLAALFVVLLVRPRGLFGSQFY